jgi:hypothetical protein
VCGGKECETGFSVMDMGDGEMCEKDGGAVGGEEQGSEGAFRMGIDAGILEGQASREGGGDLGG